MSKWTEFVYSFNVHNQPVIEQLLDDSSLSIADFDALKALTSAQLVTKFEGATLADPSFIKAFAKSFVDGRNNVDEITDYLKPLPAESDTKWQEFAAASDQAWADVINGFRTDIASLLVTDFTEYKNQFHTDLQATMALLATDGEFGYGTFVDFDAETLASLQTKVNGLTAASTVLLELCAYMLTKTAGAADWVQFTTTSLPADTNFTALLNVLEQDMTTASITYGTFSGYTASEMAGSIVNNASNFLNHLAQYLVFYKDNDWNRFKNASQSTLETEITAFTSSNSFDVLAEMIVTQANNVEVSATGDYVVKGMVVNLSGTPLVGKKVKVFDKNYKDLTQVGTTFTTNLDGEYAIGFDHVDLGNTEKESPDLEVEVFDTDGTTSLRKGPCIVNAGVETILNLAVGTGTYTGLVEYEILHRKISRVIGDADITSDTPCDIINLANRFGFGIEQVSQYLQARVFSQRFTDVDAEGFYGLLRQNAAQNLGKLLLLPSKTLVSALHRAAYDNMIARSYIEEVPGATSSVYTFADSFVALIKAHSAIVIRNVAFGDQTAINEHYANVEHIAGTSLSEEDKDDIVQVYTDTDDRKKDGDAYWSNLASETNLTTAEIDALKFSINLTSLLSNNLDFSAALIQTDDVDDMDTVLGYDTAEWQAKIDTHSITYPFEDSELTEAENESAYISSIQENLETNYPTRYVAARLDEQTTVPKSDLLIFLGNNSDFDLGNTNLTKYLNDNPSALTGVSDANQTKIDLAQLMRLFRVAPAFNKMEVIEALWNEGINSASKILLLGQAAFQKLMDGALTEDQISIVFAKASKRASKALHMYANSDKKFVNVIPSVIPETQIESGSLPDEYSDLEDQLAAGDFCACQHCQSIFSPAAYLHDLLIWLDGIKDAGDVSNTKTLLDALLERRGELDNILLNCENTNTEVPYIDLIIELLEYQVNKLQGVPDWSPYADEANFQSRQTTFNADELKAFPEHLIPSVYTSVIANTAYPWKSAGFDLWHTQWASFLQYFGIKPYELAQKISNSDDIMLDADGQMKRLLGISAVEADQIKYVSLDLHTIYGYADQASMVPMFDIANPAPVDVDTLLERTGLELDELVQYLSSKFVNPNGKQVVFASDSCSLADGNATLDFTQTDLEHLYQFYRLHQKFGGSIQELDHALGNDTSITDATLTRLGEIKLLAEKLSVSVSTVSTWFNKLHTHGYDSITSQYNTIFLDQLSIADFDTIEPLFELNTNGPELNENPITSFDDLTVEAHMKNVLSIDEEDYDALKAELGTRNLEETAKMYQYVSMARVLGISVSEILSLKTLLTFTPFTDVYEFVNRILAIKASPFSISETNYLLINSESATVPEGIPANEVVTALTALREELKNNLDNFILEKPSDRKGEVTTAIKRFAEAGITYWQSDSNVKDFFDRIERLIDTNALSNPSPHDNFKTSVASLSFDETTELDPLENYLFDSSHVDYLSPATQMNERYELIANLFTTAALGQLSSSDSMRQIVTDTFSTWLGIDAALLSGALESGDQLMNTVLNYTDFVSKSDDISTEPAYTNLIAQTKGESKLLKVADKLSIHPRHFDDLFYTGTPPANHHFILNWITDTSLGDADLTTDRFDKWIEFNQFFSTNKAYQSDTSDIADVVFSGATEAEQLVALETLTGWPTALVEGISTGSLTFDKIVLMEMAYGMVKSSGQSYKNLQFWNTDPFEQPTAEALATMVRNQAQDQGDFSAVAKFRDEIRLKQRDALMHYIIAHTESSGARVYADTFDLYDRMLADPEMGACMPSSRIKFASLSAQLFVNRILLGVEVSPSDNTKTLTLDKEDLEEWEWRKNYRVWEANRKVFTYPENWMDPDLRDDKTELFKKMENQLAQVEATSDTVSDIFTDYVEGLDDIARLEIAQMFMEEGENVLYVFARTRGAQRRYYFRKLIDDYYWTEWKEIDVEIESNHVIPVKFQGQLALFWPVFEDKGSFSGQPQQGDVVNESKYAKLSWSIFKGDKWTAVNKSTRSILLQADVSAITTEQIFFKASVSSSAPDELRIGAFGFKKNGHKENGLHNLEPQVFDEFVFKGGINSDPVTEDNPSAKGEQDRMINRYNFHGKPFNQKFRSIAHYVNESNVLDMTFAYDNYEGADTDVNILEQVEETSFITIPHQYIRPDDMLLPKVQRIPMFFEDSKRNFFIRQIFLPPTEEADSKNEAMDDAINKASDGDDGLGMSETSASASDFGPLASSEDNDNTGVQTGPNGGMTEVSLDDGSQTNASPDGTTFDKKDGNTGRKSRAMSKTKNEGWSNHGPGKFYDEPAYTPPVPPIAPTKFRFFNFYHPHTQLMLRQLGKQGVNGLLDPVFARRGTDNKQLYKQHVEIEFFEATYLPTDYVVKEVKKGSETVNVYPKENFDFDTGGAYSQYNWEVFYHAPMMMATRLMENQQFEEAKKWIEYIFNPYEVDDYDTDASPAVLGHDAPERFWKIKPFKEFCKTTATDRLITFLEGEDDELDKQLEVWQENPFSPYAIGRMRMLSFMKKTVMLYIDNLIAWGDYLFARDTMESVNEAALLYITAAKILGKKPKQVNRSGNVLSINQSMTDDMGLSKLVLMENKITGAAKLDKWANNSTGINALNLADFCLPPNDKMITYWDVVMDRLYKVRNCMNLSGLVRKLPLFEPPIDPSILVRAFASGLGVSDALAQIYDRPSPYRFAYLYQKALEYTNDVKSLGNSILSAMEKKDGEELSLLRSAHEINLLQKQLELKKKSIEEAELGIESLELNKEITNYRYQFHKNRVRRSPLEVMQMRHMQLSLAMSGISSTISSIASTMALVPNLGSGTAGLGPLLQATFGGDNLSRGMSLAASVYGQKSSRYSAEAGILGAQAGNQRRDEEWGLQEETTKMELDSIDKQMESAQLRLAIAEKEVELHQTQISQAQEVRVFMEDKYTNKELYSWMIGKLSRLYFDAYNLAFDMAKKAERAYYHELGIDQSTNSFIGFGNWNNLRRGLLAGEGLHNDLKRLDAAYTENNVREYELTKQFSLAMFNAEQLIELRETGTCDFDISEMIYDLDHPGHYYRRIKSVSVTLPCVAGPFTNVSAKLTLLNDKIRKTATVATNYQNQTSDNFISSTRGLQSIATSTGQNDSGVFELNFNDSRYLPFEYAGAISSWRLELPNKENTAATEVFRQFDYDTISDVILTVKYMAREGGNPLKEAALNNLKDYINKAVDYAASKEGLTRVVSMKSEFPSELHQFLNPLSGNHETTVAITAKHLPYVLRNETLEVIDISTVFKLKEGYEFGTPTTDVTLEHGGNSFGSATTIGKTQGEFADLYHSKFTNSPTVPPTGDWLLNAVHSNWDITKNSVAADANDAIEDILLVINYKKA